MLLHSTRLDDSPDPWLDSIVRRELAELAVSIPQWGDTGCTLANIGEFLVRSTTLLSQLANCIVYGEHINIYTSRKIQENEDANDFSELTFLDYLEDKHQSLKYTSHANAMGDLSLNHTRSIASKLQATAEHADQSWRASAKPPPASRFQSQRRQQGPRPVPYPISGPMYQAEASVYSPDQPLVEGQGYEPSYVDDQVELDARSPGSDRSAQSNTNDPFASLSSRGKGHHVCPKGASCSKGGVGPEGELIVFERNSAFRSVFSLSSRASCVWHVGVSVAAN
jgi:hypothetical protein